VNEPSTTATGLCRVTIVDAAAAEGAELKLPPPTLHRCDRVDVGCEGSLSPPSEITMLEPKIETAALVFRAESPRAPIIGFAVEYAIDPAEPQMRRWYPIAHTTKDNSFSTSRA